jgi:lipoprotein-releasing system permease protein
VVVSKFRELGILKAMGATRLQILGVFTIQGTLLAAVGGIGGAVLGIALCLHLGSIRTTASATGRLVQLFPMDLTPAVILQALAIAVGVGFFASLYPAWRAARVDAIEVIRAT